MWQGRRFKTPEYKKYEEDLLLILPKADIKDGKPKNLIIHVGFSNNASDLSNILKPFEDILCKKYGLNDKWNYQIVLRKFIVPKGEEYIKFSIKDLV